MKKAIIAVVLTLLLVGCTSNDNSANGINTPTTEYLQATFNVDVNDPKAVIGDADYVFVGHVEELVDTVYKNAVKVGSKEISDPYTNYTITVIENIKGKLKKNNAIPIQQAGGLSKDGSKYILYENDTLLEKGKYYVIAAYAQPDGSLLIAGPNSSVLISAQSKNDVVSTNEYKEYKKAFENEIKTDRKRFASIHVE
ncbi:hypothetical protein [Cohnella yongneupensis]|uniref:Uncharacterized protein n=1 Tax=Cohnella yongneupensis TaxID=425006 RepID=A0ABW0QT46_9BACL